MVKNKREKTRITNSKKERYYTTNDSADAKKTQ